MIFRNLDRPGLGCLVRAPFTGCGLVRSLPNTAQASLGTVLSQSPYVPEQSFAAASQSAWDSPARPRAGLCARLARRLSLGERRLVAPVHGRPYFSNGPPPRTRPNTP